MSRDWDSLSGLELRRALAEVQGWGYRNDRWCNPQGEPRQSPAWEADHGDALRLLENVLWETGHSVEYMQTSNMHHACIMLGGKIGPVYEAHGDTLPEAIARACGKVLEAHRK